MCVCKIYTPAGNVRAKVATGMALGFLYCIDIKSEVYILHIAPHDGVKNSHNGFWDKILHKASNNDLLEVLGEKMPLLKRGGRGVLI